MSSPFDKLFPQDLLTIAKTILKLKRSYDNCVPKLLCNEGYFKYSKDVYINNYKNIILFYKRGDCKRKRQDAFNELIRISGFYTNISQTPPELIYGYLGDSETMEHP